MPGTKVVASSVFQFLRAVSGRNSKIENQNDLKNTHKDFVRDAQRLSLPACVTYSNCFLSRSKDRPGLRIIAYETVSYTWCGPSSWTRAVHMIDNKVAC